MANAPQRVVSVGKLVDTITQSFADVGAAHPEWKGKKAVFLQGAFYEGAALASPAMLETALPA